MRFARRRAAIAFAALAAVLALVLPSRAQDVALPQPVGYVNDFAHAIDAAYRDSIQAVIDDVRQKSGGEIVVVTLDNTGGRDAAQVALEIGRQWKVGQKGGPTDPNRNTGAIVLVSMQDHHWRIETGTGTMTFIPAGEAGRIGRGLMVPELQAGHVGRGIYLAVSALAQAYAQHFGFQLSPVVAPVQVPAEEPQPTGAPSGGGPDVQFWITIAFVLLFFVLPRLLGGRRGGRGGCGGGGCLPIFIPMGGGGRYRGGGGWGGGGGFGGGGGGGFGGFGGGGGFSGGGSGGNW